jgi:hypothetical protein
MRSTCRRCGGRGSIITNPCVVCRGAGQAKQKKRVTIPVPAGGPLPGRRASMCACCMHDCTVRDKAPTPWLKEELDSFLFKIYLFIYLFYVYEYTVAEQMVVSLHVLVGN